MQSLWNPLAATPLPWLAATLIAYGIGLSIQRLCRRSALANPVLIAIGLLVALLKITGVPYATYFEGARFIHFLLGPATVALAVPLALNLAHVRRGVHGMSIALIAGSLTAAISGTAVVWLMGGSRAVALSMAPKAATTPIAMAVAQQSGGLPALTAVLAISGGILTAMIGRSLFKALKIDDWRAQGLASGVAGSGVGAAQIAPLSALAAAFAALGVGLNGIVTSLIVPVITWLWPG
jgi:putative effector of murein hydrolase